LAVAPTQDAGQCIKKSSSFGPQHSPPGVDDLVVVRESERWERLGCKPGDFGQIVTRDGFARGRYREVNCEHDGFSGAGIEPKQIANLDVKSDFLFRLPGGGIFNPLAPFDKARRKAPFARLARVRAPFAHQQLTVAFDHHRDRQFRIEVRNRSANDADRSDSLLDLPQTRFVSTLLAIHHCCGLLAPGVFDERRHVGLELGERLCLQVDHVPDLILLDLDVGAL
jgi:hypothetical protein